MQTNKILFSLICLVGLLFSTGCNRKNSSGTFVPPPGVELTIGTPITATFETFGEVDYYCVQLEGGTLYKITTANLGANVNTLLQLFTEDGLLLIESDDANGTLASEIFFWSPIDAKYCIRVTDLDNVVPEGIYDLLVEFIDVTGPPGLPGTDGQDGEDGQDGQDGEDGEDGEDGQPPSVIARYRLCNHPGGSIDPPPYGLRLDELFDATEGHDKFTFDFNAPGSFVFMDYDGVSIRIYGIAFGGRDIGSKFDPEMSGYAYIDFTYPLATQVPGDDDLQSHAGTGTVIWKVGTPDAVTINLEAYAGSHDFAFRFGNEDNDNGHRSFRGFSGWGWLNHSNAEGHVAASDWLFTVCEHTVCKKHKRRHHDDDDDHDDQPQ